MSLRPYQQAALEGLVGYFASGGKGHPIVSMPTGAGKSHIIAAFAEYAQQWGSRLLVATHSKELVAQDYHKLADLLGEPAVGIYSAGLGRRDTTQPVLCAGIQSAVTPMRGGHMRVRDELLAGRDLVLIDECHLMPFDGKGRYRTLFQRAQELNPRVRFVGLTATPYRGSGRYLHQGTGALFTDVCHEVDVESLVDDGYLSELVARSTKQGNIETKGIRSRQGDFVKGDLERAAMADDRVSQALDEACELGADRRSWLVFACSVAHGQAVLAELQRRGIRSAIVTGTTAPDARDRAIRDYKAGLLRALVNVNVLTTGFDAPQTDLLVVLRPTKSVVLYVQMMGRGMRITPGKSDCLVLDYGGNVHRHGPINAIRATTSPKGETVAGTAPVKECPECMSLVHAALRACSQCGFEFPIDVEPKHETRAAKAEIIARRKPRETAAWAVSAVSYRAHTSTAGKRSLRVDYLCGLQSVSEWICVEHSGVARAKAEIWWSTRSRLGLSEDIGRALCPTTVDEALQRALAGELRQPEAIWVRTGGEYLEVRGEASAEAVGESMRQG